MQPWQQTNPTNNIQAKHQAQLVEHLHQLTQIYACAYGSEWEEVDHIYLPAPLQAAADDLATQVITWQQNLDESPPTNPGETPTPADWINYSYSAPHDQGLLDILDEWHTHTIRQLLTHHHNHTAAPNQTNPHNKKTPCPKTSPSPSTSSP